MVVNNGLFTHLSDSLACQILTSGVSPEDLTMFKHYNLPEQWEQLILLTFAFLLQPTPRKTLFIHDWWPLVNHISMMRLRLSSHRKVKRRILATSVGIGY